MDQIIVFFISGKNNVVFEDMSIFFSPFDNIVIDFLAHLLTARQGDNAKGSYRDIVQVAFITT